MPVCVSHLLDVCQTSYGECLPSVNVPGGIFVWLVDMARNAVAPVLMVSCGWVFRRWEAVDQLAVGVWQLDVFINLVWDPLDLELLKSALARCGEFLASFTQDSVATLDRVHPYPVVVVAERQEVRPVCFEEGHAGVEVLADSIGFLLLRGASAKAGEVEHVTQANLVVRFPLLAEVEELLNGDRAAKFAMVVGSDDEFLEAHVLDFKFVPGWEEDFLHAPDHRFLIVILHPADSRQKQRCFHHLVA